MGSLHKDLAWELEKACTFLVLAIRKCEAGWSLDHILMDLQEAFLGVNKLIPYPKQSVFDHETTRTMKLYYTSVALDYAFLQTRLAVLLRDIDFGMDDTQYIAADLSEMIDRLDKEYEWEQ